MHKTFIYTQTRLQARHGMRPDEHIWQIVESKKDLANYLQSAKQTSLRYWVAGLQSTDNHHIIETTLAKLYREYVLDVAHWVPSAWRESVEWVAVLIYLPAIQHLLLGNTSRSWMVEIPELKGMTMSNLNMRVDAFSQSPYAPLLDAWQENQPLVSAWLTCWQSLWPEKKSRAQAPLQQLIATVHEHLEIFHQLSPATTWRQRQRLAARLTLMFRKNAYQPVAIFIHLLLVALDIERLRSAILQRSLFPNYQEKSA
jgi:hypothetical protein